MTPRKFAEEYGWPTAIMFTVLTITLIIGSLMLTDLASGITNPYNASSCTYYGKGWISGPWYCSMSANGLALCGTGGTCLAGTCQYPPLCNQTQNAIIQQNTTSWIYDD